MQRKSEPAVVRIGLAATLLLAVLAMLASPVAYAQGTPDGETPANERVCDDLFGATLGLYGLCVAFCEAQDCEATFDPATGEVTFDPDCYPSDPKILDIYNRLKTPEDPSMPCVNVVENECPCWTEQELDLIAESRTDVCEADDSTTWQVNGLNANGGFDLALATVFGGGFCVYNEETSEPSVNRFLELSLEEVLVCGDSILAECATR